MEDTNHSTLKNNLDGSRGTEDTTPTVVTNLQATSGESKQKESLAETFIQEERGAGDNIPLSSIPVKESISTETNQKVLEDDLDILKVSVREIAVEPIADLNDSLSDFLSESVQQTANTSSDQVTEESLERERVIASSELAQALVSEKQTESVVIPEALVVLQNDDVTRSNVLQVEAHEELEDLLAGIQNSGNETMETNQLSQNLKQEELIQDVNTANEANNAMIVQEENIINTDDVLNEYSLEKTVETQEINEEDDILKEEQILKEFNLQPNSEPSTEIEQTQPDIELNSVKKEVIVDSFSLNQPPQVESVHVHNEVQQKTNEDEILNDLELGEPMETEEVQLPKEEDILINFDFSPSRSETVQSTEQTSKVQDIIDEFNLDVDTTKEEDLTDIVDEEVVSETDDTKNYPIIVGEEVHESFLNTVDQVTEVITSEVIDINNTESHSILNSSPGSFSMATSAHEITVVPAHESTISKAGAAIRALNEMNENERVAMNAAVHENDINDEVDDIITSMQNNSSVSCGEEDIQLHTGNQSVFTTSQIGGQATGIAGLDHQNVVYTNAPLSGAQNIMHSNTAVTSAYNENASVVTSNVPRIGTQYESTSDDESVNPKPKKSASFNLGVPGLQFNSQNVRVANDGTKLVQIHQSQITPNQLQALQANPNIKVVFRHIPSGKSFSKAPRNLFSSLANKKNKRKAELSDESIYNFEDEFSTDYGYAQRTRKETEYPRYNPNVGMKKRRAGRPKSIPDPGLSLNSSNKQKQPTLPAQVALTEALNKLNKPAATITLKLHISQVTLEVLDKMQLSPDFNLAITTQHDVANEASLKQIANEWAEKEVEDDVVETNANSPSLDGLVMPPPAPVVSNIVSSEVSRKRKHAGDTFVKPEPKKRGRKTLAEERERARENEEKQKAEQAEDDLLTHILTEQTSRSGRVRKPSRYSVDIARLTKRSKYDLGQDDDIIPLATVPSPSPVKKPYVQTAVATDGVPVVKRPKGRPRKFQSDVYTSEHNESITPLVKFSIQDQIVVWEVMEKQGLLPVGTVKKARDELERKKKETERIAAEAAATAAAASQALTKIPSVVPSSPKKAKELVASNADEVDFLATFFRAEQTPEVDAEKKKDESTSADVEPAEDMDINDLFNQVKDAETPLTTTQDSQKDSNAKASTCKDVLKTSGESPSDILARKLKIIDPKESVKPPESTTQDWEIDDGTHDDKYRLRKLLQACTIDEIISSAIPSALSATSIGDFFLYKSGQMSKEQVSFTSLYKQLENLHGAVSKESSRYSTLLRRANKVGGDRRMDRVIMMPVYNKVAAESLAIKSTTIDAHIGYIQHSPTAQMIVANSFKLNCKMDPPIHRLDLPDLADKKTQNRKRGGVYGRTEDGGSGSSMFSTQKRWQNRPSYSNSTAHSSGSSYKQQRTNNNTGFASRKSYMNSSQSATSSSTMQGNSVASATQVNTAVQETARQQMANQRNPLNFDHVTQSVVNPNQMDSSVNSMLNQVPVETTSVMNSVVSSTPAIVTNQGENQTQQIVRQHMNMDENSGGGGTLLHTSDEGKQLVSLGDGQYFELPEGYTLIQTDEGYIIGQPGATFVQGEDGNVYMTNGDDAAELNPTDQIIATNATVTNQVVSQQQVPEQGASNEQLLQHLSQG